MMRPFALRAHVGDGGDRCQEHGRQTAARRRRGRQESAAAALERHRPAAAPPRAEWGC